MSRRQRRATVFCEVLESRRVLAPLVGNFLGGGAGRFADLTAYDSTAHEDLLELEPHDGDPRTATIDVVAGRTYILRLRASNLAPVAFTVDLKLASVL